jgi:hypothetical protein
LVFPINRPLISLPWGKGNKKEGVSTMKKRNKEGKRLKKRERKIT